MPFETLTFENDRGDRLPARLDLPVDGVPIAFALFAHCFTCAENLQAADNISQALNREGLAVLRFDFTGLGEQEGDFADTTFSPGVDDLVAAAAFLERDYAAPAILVGHSLGGAAVVQAALRIDSVRAVATIGAPFDPQHVEHLFEPSLEAIEAGGDATVRIEGCAFTVKKRFLDDLRSEHAKDHIARLRRALLLFHSPVDNVVGIENAALLFKAARHPKSYVSLDHADHLLSQAADAEYVGTVLAAWARKYIGAPQEARKHLDPGDNQVVARLDGAGYRTEMLANGFPLVADEPFAVGGTNAGPNPYDLLTAALAACTAMTLRMYADHKKWPLEAVEVRLTHQKIHAKDCHRCEQKDGKLDVIERELTLFGPLDEAQRQRITEIADKCPVHRTLGSRVEIFTTLHE